MTSPSSAGAEVDELRTLVRSAKVKLCWSAPRARTPHFLWIAMSRIFSELRQWSLAAKGNSGQAAQAWGARTALRSGSKMERRCGVECCL